MTPGLSSPMPAIAAGATVLPADQILVLCYVATGGIVVMWVAFWFVVYKQDKESVSAVLLKPAFFRVVAVVGVVAAAAVLTLAGRLESTVTGAILSGTIGFVLGHLSSKQASAD